MWVQSPLPVQILCINIDMNKIDVVIPCIHRNIYTLQLCVEGLRKNVIDPINNIYVISPKNDDILNICKQLNIININEIEVVGFEKQELISFFGSRSGWYYQQFIKLNGDKVVETDNYLAIDSDHILLNKHQFIDNDKYVFYYSDEYHIPYFILIKKIFDNKYDKHCKYSFISDKMIFNKQYLNELKNEITNIHNNDFISVILQSSDSSTSFSEFETYGTWLSYNYPDKIKLLSCNRLMSFNKLNLSYDELQNKYKNYLSVTEFALAT